MKSAGLSGSLGSALVLCMAISGSTNVLAQAPADARVALLAAGSLKNAMDEIGQAFQRETGVGVNGSFGPSGKLRKEIEAGRNMDVFASASIEHTDALLEKKLVAQSVVFAHNDLCVVSRHGFN